MMVDSFVTTIMHAIDLYLNMDRLLNSCESVMLTFIHIKCLINAASLLNRKKEISILLTELDDMYASFEKDKPRAPVMARTLKWTKRLVVMLPAMYCGTVAVFLTSMLPFVTPIRETYFR